MSAKLKNALAFAELGIPILPLACGSMKPAVGPKATATDPKTLRRLYEKHSDYNYGLVTEGEVFAVSVNDDDAKSHFLNVALKSGEPSPTTVTLRIGSSRYYLFRSRGMNVPSCQNKLGSGIDIHGEGGVVLGPGSKLDSGIKSRFAKAKGLDDVQILKCPKRLWHEIVAAPEDAKPPTKADLLSVARTEIKRGEHSWRKAAGALARAQDEFHASQREMATAVGRSVSWVNWLLKWCRSGYTEESPFGPTTKAGRVAHAEQRANRSKNRKGKRSPKPPRAGAEAENAVVGAERGEIGSDSGIHSKALAPEMAELGRSTTPDSSAAAQIGRLEADSAAATARVRHLEQELATARSHTATESADIPAFLDRRPLSSDDQRAFDAINSAFENSPAFRTACASASILALQRFIRDVLLGEAA